MALQDKKEEYNPAKGSGFARTTEGHDGVPRQGTIEEAEELTTFGHTASGHSTKPLTRLNFFKDGECHSFQFGGLDPHSFYEPGKFILTFRGLGGGHRVTVTGRNLWQLYEYCTMHRWSAIAEDMRDVFSDKERYIKSIEVKPIEDQGKQLFP